MKIEIKSKTLQLFEGYKAQFEEGYLFRKKLGTHIWDALPIKCSEQYSTLYNGRSTTLKSEDLPSMVYINEPKLGGQIFVELLQSDTICEQTPVYTTGVDGIFVQVVSNVVPAFFPKEKEKLDPLNMAITHFIQTKPVLFLENCKWTCMIIIHLGMSKTVIWKMNSGKQKCSS